MPKAAIDVDDTLLDSVDLHVVTPLARPKKGQRLTWAQAKQFARDVCSTMAADSPDRYLINMRSPAGLKKPVSIDEILESLCELDGGPRNPPGGKPCRLRSTERAIAA